MTPSWPASFEPFGTRQFISTLEAKQAALDDSILTGTQLGALTLHFCPQCLAPLGKVDGANICTLCKQETGSAEALSKAARLRQEIALQIRESNAVAGKRREEFDRSQALYQKLQEQIKRTQKDFDRLAGLVQTQRDAELDRLLQDKGRLERTLDDLSQQLKVLGVVTTLREDEAKLIVQMQELEIAIKRRLDDQAAKLYQALAQIQKYTIGFLRDDSKLEYEGFFATASDLTIDLPNNTFQLDKRNQFSASSVTLLKNSVHFGLLFASLDLDFFRYPRLIVCDNMEDKGMKPERSQNFQRTVVALSRAAKVEHQIIFTTSMIDPSLDTAEYCIGPNYVGAIKTLEIGGIKAPIQEVLPTPPASNRPVSKPPAV